MYLIGEGRCITSYFNAQVEGTSISICIPFLSENIFGYFTFSFFDINANNTLCLYKSSSNYNKLLLFDLIERDQKIRNISLVSFIIYRVQEKEFSLSFFYRWYYFNFI